ncbi:MAG: Alcohol dehydrogenase 2 [Chloroflexi bacterium ADurb.Bin325]|nr:MAG: Alcohol dehydrogenase 2 [Chloroflexi bacterium ADurb.Bin325]
MRFEFATAQRIIFGAGTLRQAGPLIAELGRAALLVTGEDRSRADPLRAVLDAAGVTHATFSVPGEPTTDEAREGAEQVAAHGCDIVIGIGGGSAIDAAKAIAVLSANGGDPLDYLEVVGRGQPLTRPALPIVAIPTTAGTGAEATRNAVLAAPEHQIKASLRSPTMLPRLAVVDPELTYGLPPEVTASTGLDALTQLIEPFTSVRANPLTDGFCREGMGRIARSLAAVYENGANAAARVDMALASLLGGLALANAGLGVAHGFAGPVGGMFPAPHGAVCAAFLPHVMAANIRALVERAPGSPMLHRYDEIAHILTGDPAARAADGIRWVQALTAQLRIPALGAYGVRLEDAPALVEKTLIASSTKANPIVLTREELTEILTRAL